jgi:hypothetical protein
MGASSFGAPGLEQAMTDSTVFTFDRPDTRRIVFERLLPIPRRDDIVEIDGESRDVRSATLVVDTQKGNVTLYVHLRG